MKTVLHTFVLCGLLMLLPSASFGADPKITLKKSGAVLTLPEVIANVLLKTPELQVFSFEIRAREARALQEGLAVTERPVSYRRRVGRSKIAGTVRGTLAAGVTILSTIASLRSSAHASNPPSTR